MIGYIIKDDSCLEKGATWLGQNDPILADALKLTGPLPLRLTVGGFPALLKAIVGQQISVASALSVWARLEAANLVDEQTVANSSEDILRANGLSRPKARYALELANSGFDYAALRALPNEEVIKRLMTLKGIGRWSADIYTMFSLGRADAFAQGDLAIQETAKILYDLPSRPTELELAQIAQDWSPWRSVAARLLWSYYKISKQREGILK